MNKSVTNAPVTRWLLLLQEVDITIVDRPGKEKVVADFLSRIKTDDNTPVDDSFPVSTCLQYLLTHRGMQTLPIIWLQGSYNHTYQIGRKERSFNKVLSIAR